MSADRAVGGLAGHLFAGRMDHVERRPAAGVLEFAVDEHPLVAGQHAGVTLHLSRMRRQLHKIACECHPLWSKRLTDRQVSRW